MKETSLPSAQNLPPPIVRCGSALVHALLLEYQRDQSRSMGSDFKSLPTSRRTERLTSHVVHGRRHLHYA